MVLERIAEAVEKLVPEKLLRPDPKVRGAHLDVTVRPEQVRALAKAVRDHEFLLKDVTALDASPQMMVLYHFSHPDEHCTIQGRALVDREKPEIPTIREIFPGADWHERETHDFFGLVFLDHPDLTNLILPDESADLKPLLKDEKALKPLGALLPEFAPEGAEAPAEGEGEKPRPRPVKKEKAPKAEGEA